MVDIDKLVPEIIESLKPLDPHKIILFGSYAYGNPNDESDIDLFVVKDVNRDEVRDERLKGQRLLWNLIKKEKIGFDLFLDSDEAMKSRINHLKDQFYKDIVTKGKVLYAK